MILPPDLHMHTPLCRHATGEPVDYARRAIELGLKEIGFSDHSPMRQDDFDDWRMRFDQLSEYVENVRRAQKEFPQLTIRLALEVDYLPGHEDWIRELSGLHDWDYLIGSVHYVSDSWAIDNPHMISEWSKRNPAEVWSVYFERLTMAAETGLFQIIGHVDLPKKFGHRIPSSAENLVGPFLQAARRRHCAIELNTAGLRKDCREIYPHGDILRAALREGVPITFGSDAHAATEVGMDFGKALSLAKEVGFTHGLSFEQRQARSFKL